jgi:hypothetical protein
MAASWPHLRSQDPLTGLSIVITRWASLRQRTRQKTKKRTSGPQSLLIVHFDAPRLKAQGLHLGDMANFSGGLSRYALGSEVEVRDVTTWASFEALRAELVADKRTFDVIVCIGHSNAREIRVASDVPTIAWEQFATWLQPLRPRRLLLAACQAGRWDAGEVLFSANRYLTRILACPVNASRDFAELMLVAVPYVVANRTLQNRPVLWGQLLALGTTGRQLREWRATSDKGNPDRAVFDMIADLMDPLARQVPAAINSFFKSVFGP